jgi:hypothetical protein
MDSRLYNSFIAIDSIGELLTQFYCCENGALRTAYIPSSKKHSIVCTECGKELKITYRGKENRDGQV